MKAQIRKLDHETNDLKFLNNQYVHKVRCLEKDGKIKSERIQQLQEKNMQAVVQTPGKVMKQTSPARHMCLLLPDVYGTIMEMRCPGMNLNMSLSHAGGKKHSIPFRRQRMQIDELVPPPFTSAYPVSQPDDPYVADLLQLADGRSVR